MNDELGMIPVTIITIAQERKSIAAHTPYGNGSYLLSYCSVPFTTRIHRATHPLFAVLTRPHVDDQGNLRFILGVPDKTDRRYRLEGIEVCFCVKLRPLSAISFYQRIEDNRIYACVNTHDPWARNHTIAPEEIHASIWNPARPIF